MNFLALVIIIACLQRTIVFILQLCTFILGSAILSRSKFEQFVLNLHVDFMISEIRGGSMRHGSRGGWTPLHCCSVYPQAKRFWRPGII